MRRLFYLSLALLTGLSLSAFGGQKEQAPVVKGDAATNSSPRPAVLTPPPLDRSQDFATVMHGAKLYRQNCAKCHGATAGGDPNWRMKRPDGRFPPPPLNGTGHAWHHPLDDLKETIRGGTVKLGGGMPSWGDKMTGEEIEAVIAWIVSRWPDEIYKRWQKGHH